MNRGLALLAALAVVAGAVVLAQGPPPAAARSARESALIDITGQWVSVVTEDWRWRMVTPPKGDTSSVPLNAAGRKTAQAWDLSVDRTRGALCKAFGPPALIRQPGRVRIRWENANTLLLEFDAGTQVRRFRFGASAAAGVRSLQGDSEARWFRQPQNRGILAQSAPTPGGSLEVVTTNMQAAYLRPNGVPYSERAVVKEFFDSFTFGEDGTWLIVTTVVSDPTFLTQEFVISSQFKKETDRSKWNPRPCEIPAPLR
ncbi:MAG TPA: hypothetical protein VFP91_13215 [Vicinamibacterales bacterium]|nr:hypothetical protein [Vicinamibacterales bacterium]